MQEKNIATNLFDPELLAFTHNNSPTERLSGLSPIQFFELTHNSFLKHSPVKMIDDVPDKVYDQVPFLNLVEVYLGIILRDGFIKLTPLGKIPVKILKEIYDFGILPDDSIERGINKLSSEDYWIVMTAVKQVCKKASLTRIEKNKMVLVKKNMFFLLPENRTALFRMLYLNYTEEFNWAYFDGYPNIPAGQYGVNFTIYLLLKFGNQYRETSFYAQRYLRGYHKFKPFFEDETAIHANYFENCYSLRSFLRFSNWFGLTNSRETGFLKNEVIASECLDKIFRLDYNTPVFE